MAFFIPAALIAGRAAAPTVGRFLTKNSKNIFNFAKREGKDLWKDLTFKNYKKHKNITNQYKKNKKNIEKSYERSYTNQKDMIKDQKQMAIKLKEQATGIAKHTKAKNKSLFTAGLTYGSTAATVAPFAFGSGGGENNVTPQSVQDVTLPVDTNTTVKSTNTNTTVKPTVKPKTITEVANNIIEQKSNGGDNSFMDLESSADYKKRMTSGTTREVVKKSSSPTVAKTPTNVVSKPKVKKTKKTVTKKAPVVKKAKVKTPMSKGRQASKNPFSKDFSWGALGLDNAAVRKIDSKNGINTDYYESGPEPDLIGEHKAIIAAAKKRKSLARQKKLTAEANKIMDLF